MAAPVKKTVELFYDVLSPYTWFAFEVLCRYKTRWNMDLKLKPFFLSGIMAGSDNKPPGVVVNKANYMTQDLERCAKYFNVPMKLPEDIGHVLFVKGSLSAQRFLTAVDIMDPTLTEAVSRQLWMRTWSRDEDMTELDSLKQAGEKAGLNLDQVTHCLQMIKDPKIKDRLKQYTSEALEYGAFGSPTIIAHVDKPQMFFGSDRFPILAETLEKNIEDRCSIQVLVLAVIVQCLSVMPVYSSTHSIYEKYQTLLSEMRHYTRRQKSSKCFTKENRKWKQSNLFGGKSQSMASFSSHSGIRPANHIYKSSQICLLSVSPLLNPQPSRNKSTWTQRQKENLTGHRSQAVRKVCPKVQETKSRKKTKIRASFKQHEQVEPENVDVPFCPIYYDLETTGLGKEAEITQVAAFIDTDTHFNCYILPNTSITPYVSRLTGLSVRRRGGERKLFKDNQQVDALDVQAAMGQFLAWLSQLNVENKLLVAHNGHTFDMPMLFRALILTNLVDELSKNVIGFVDSLPLIRECMPEMASYRLVALNEYVTGKKFQGHDALEDARALWRVVNDIGLVNCDLQAHSVSTTVALQCFNGEK